MGFFSALFGKNEIRIMSQDESDITDLIKLESLIRDNDFYGVYINAEAKLKGECESGERIFSCMLLGMLYAYGINIKTNIEMAEQYFKKFLLSNHILARKAYIYLSALETEKGNNDLALDYLRKGSDAGDEVAMAELGVCYAAGEGVPQDYNKAKELWTKAAKLGNKGALDNLNILKSM